jgi:hypothetical protein
MASSPEFWKNPGGPIKPQPVKLNPRFAQVIASDSDILKDATKKTRKNIKNRCLVLIMDIIRKYIITQV